MANNIRPAPVTAAEYEAQFRREYRAIVAHPAFAVYAREPATAATENLYIARRFAELVSW